MIERLEHGKVYDCRLFQGMRKVIFLGSDPRRIVSNRNVILTRPYRGNETKAYRFGNDYVIEGAELKINGNVRSLKKTEAEEIYAKELLEKYGL